MNHSKVEWSARSREAGPVSIGPVPRQATSRRGALTSRPLQLAAVRPRHQPWRADYVRRYSTKEKPEIVAHDAKTGKVLATLPWRDGADLFGVTG